MDGSEKVEGLFGQIALLRQPHLLEAGERAFQALAPREQQARPCHGAAGWSTSQQNALLSPSITIALSWALHALTEAQQLKRSR